MDKELIQTVFQINQGSVPKRMIVQFTNDVGEEIQTINNYEDLTESEKVIFDSFEELSKSKMV